MSFISLPPTIYLVFRSIFFSCSCCFFEIILKQNKERKKMMKKSILFNYVTNKENFCSVCFLEEKVFNLPLHVYSISKLQRYRKIFKLFSIKTSCHKFLFLHSTLSYFLHNKNTYFIYFLSTTYIPIVY